MAQNIVIRNSTAEFLIFILEGQEDGIQVMYKNETIWATQKAIVIGKDKYSEIGKKGYIKNGNNDAVKTATSVQ